MLIAAGPEPAPKEPAPPASEPAKGTLGEIPVFNISPDKVVAVLGQQVVGPLGTVLGRLVDVLVNKDGVPEAAVIDFGGFLGVGSRKIAVHWNTLHFNPGDAKYPIVLDLMPAQIKAAPSYKGESKPAAVVVAPWEPPPGTPGAAAPPTQAAPVAQSPAGAKPSTSP
ncbi:MAG TPA: PRC-barrel domain-containing protein [Acetobacteraceae bacterium]